ncbi:hypothetical protein RND71_009970 [Anisodus tanguticus]|uniref:Fungal lipase-type domain-containing protein n=1 Tax=Anisodus tanguticus TaxID=243964 RepID=A0AAE1VSB1_9SOLA|nr:hypothetical protein RND71_009970 [Anisodus tanguticus]
MQILCKLIVVLSYRDGKELKVKDQGTIYNHTLATILVEYAATVYVTDLAELFTWTCPRCDDLTKGFQIIELIVDVKRCLQAFVEVAPDLSAIVIAFRGTQGTRFHSTPSRAHHPCGPMFNLILDIEYPGMEDAMVHHGFYSAYHNTTLRPGVLSAVKRAKELYGDIPIMVTGHSMGGAIPPGLFILFYRDPSHRVIQISRVFRGFPMLQLPYQFGRSGRNLFSSPYQVDLGVTGNECPVAKSDHFIRLIREYEAPFLCSAGSEVNYGSQNVAVMTFGQPRIGNAAAFASYYSKWVPNTIRVTHA